jgi:hypothetical protein
MTIEELIRRAERELLNSTSPRMLLVANNYCKLVLLLLKRKNCPEWFIEKIRERMIKFYNIRRKQLYGR